MDEFNGSLSMVVFCFHRLAIQTDENDALKEALSSTLKAKEEDLDLGSEQEDILTRPEAVQTKLCT